MSENKKKKLTELALGIFWGIMVCILLTFCSCTTTKYVSVPEYHTEYIHTTDTLIHRDSTFTHDSVFLYINGDTVFKTMWRTEYKERLKYINHTDTICKTDSINVPVYVEKKESTLHKVVYDIGLLAILILAVMTIMPFLKRKFSF